MVGNPVVSDICGYRFLETPQTDQGNSKHRNRGYIHAVPRQSDCCLTEAHLQATGGIKRRLDEIFRATF
jgi:hypothetical protein